MDKKNNLFALRLTTKELIKLLTLAEQKGIKPSDYIRNYINYKFDQEQKENPEYINRIYNYIKDRENLDDTPQEIKNKINKPAEQPKKEHEETTSPQAVDKQFVLNEVQNLMDFLELPEDTPEKTFFNRIKNDKKQIIYNVDLAAAKLDSIYKKGIGKATIKDINEILFIITNGKEAPTKPLKKAPKEQPKQKTEKIDTAADTAKNQELIQECINCINEFGNKTQKNKISLIQKMVEIKDTPRIENQIKKIYKYYQENGKATINGVNTLLALLGIYKD